MTRVPLGLAGLLVVSLAGCAGSASTSGSPVASAVASANAAPSLVAPTVSPRPSPSLAMGWRVVATRSDLATASLKDMTTFRGSLIAVGTATDAPLGVIWSSPDGEVWTSIAGATPLDGASLNAVAVGDPGIVVVGWSETNAVALFSPDGTLWSRQQLPGSHAGSSIVSVAWRQGRFVAVGGGGEPGAVVSWMSDDGRTWVPVSIFAEGNQASLNSVAAGPDGFVADGMYRRHPAIWTSPDGKAWKRSDLPGSTADDPGRLRFAGGHFFLPLIFLPLSGGDLLCSTDGQRWSRTTVPGFGVGIFDVAVIPGGFVAIGRSSEGSEPIPGSYVPGVVATADGDLTRWTQQPADAAMSGALASSALISPDGTYLVGVGMSISGESVFLLPKPSVPASQ